CMANTAFADLLLFFETFDFISDLMLGTVIGTLLLLAIFGYFLCKPVIVSQGEMAIVERLGVFYKILEPGLHFIFPILEGEKHVHWTYTEESSDRTRTRVKQDGR